MLGLFLLVLAFAVLVLTFNLNFHQITLAQMYLLKNVFHRWLAIDINYFQKNKFSPLNLHLLLHPLSEMYWEKTNKKFFQIAGF